MSEPHKWQYCSLGGVIRVRISNGEDIARLGELDEKYWTVLSCPAGDLLFDKDTLRMMDTDGDGMIKVHEVVNASRWLCSVVKDKDSILKGGDVISLDNIDRENREGARLYDSARQILSNLGIEGNSISLADASDSVAIFRNTVLNGDGVIIPATADDAAARAAIEACIATMGSVKDRSGNAGVDAGLIGAFYDACAGYAAWKDKAEKNAASIFVYGDDTAAAYAAVAAVKDKVNDYFTRCKLLAYDRSALDAVSVPVENISGISACPLARPDASCVLQYTGLNPAWQAAFDKVKALVIDRDPRLAGGLGEAGWQKILGSFAAFEEWNASKEGAEVESLGIDKVRELLADDRKQALLDLVDEDRKLEAESDSIDDVNKLLHYYRDFARLLDNYVIFSDFYKRDPERRAVFEAGKLYIDQRCCDLCVKVTDMGQHADMAKLSGMFLMYCKCVSRHLGKTMDIVAVMTDGDTEDLRPGKNGVFYDLEGNDWDATITKVVDNPISVKQAFWAPYRKFWAFCVGLINKSAADKEAKVITDLQSKVAAAPAAAPADGAAKPQPFDIAKFAGIFAALGLALGYIGSFFTKLAAGIAATPLWQLAVAIVVIMLIISGPSCFIAWSKLRKRNLGPVLNANGWAVNSKVLINILFGSRLTTVARYPKIRMYDPNRPKSRTWLWILVIVLLAAAVPAVLHSCGVIDLMQWFK